MATSGSYTVQQLEPPVAHDEDGDDDDDDDAADDDDRIGPFAAAAISFQTAIYGFFRLHGRTLGWCLLALCGVLYAIYFVYAEQHKFHDNYGLLVLTCLVVALLVYAAVKRRWGAALAERCRPCIQRCDGPRAKYVKWGIMTALVLAVIIFLIVDARKEPIRLMSGVGIPVYILLAFLTSNNPSKVQWRMVLSGLLMQFAMGLLVLKWSTGNRALEWFGEQVIIFLSYSDVGSAFVFGDFSGHEFAFLVLPTLVYFGSLVSLLYYLGILQAVIRSMGNVIEFVMRVGSVEAFVAAANIFLGVNVALLTVAKFMPFMTLAELHSMMTSGFATSTGALFSSYASFGVAPSHLISASVMSAPAALIFSKMLYPENEKSQLRDLKHVDIAKSQEHSAVEAFCVGAYTGLPIVASIAVNLVAFVAALEFINLTLTWFGDRVGIDQLTFQMICSYIFVPFSFFMGFEVKDCFNMAKLIGIKLFLGDIFGYKKLGEMMNNRKDANSTGPYMSERSEVMATYAMCGFGNFTDIGIVLGTIAAIVPKRSSDVARIAIRAMVAGNLACFMTACIAGLMYAVPSADDALASDFNNSQIL